MEEMAQEVEEVEEEVEVGWQAESRGATRPVRSTHHVSQQVRPTWSSCILLTRIIPALQDQPF